MSTYQSIQQGSGDDGSVTITKPVSLAVGDLMLAGIVHEYGGAGTVSVSTPIGWTKVDSVNVLSDCELAVFYKIADSGDVAASNFTFTATGGSSSGQTLGSIVHITSFGLMAGYDAFAEQNLSATLTIPGGFTPSRGNILLVGFVSKSSTITTGTFTSLALATDNPSWTERTDFEFGTSGGSYDTRLAVYTATRTALTPTGNITVTNSSTNDARYLGLVVALAPVVNGSVTPTTEINAYALTGIQSVKLNAVTEDASTSESYPTIWTNEAKPTATTWTNQDK